MRTDTNLQFIREKIYKVRSAIMYSISDDLIKLPNSIITAVKVDEEGQLWFLCNKPAQRLEQCPQSFPVRLHFYRKGTFFHLEVSGKAEIVNNNYMGDPNQEKPLLIRMNMVNVEYTEQEDKHRTMIEAWVEKAYAWMLRHISVSHESKPVLSRLQSMNRS
jgi:general stress protein 26